MRKLPRKIKPVLKDQTGGIFIWLLLIILLVMLIGGGLALAVYLGFIPTDGIMNKVRQTPVIAKFLPHKEETSTPSDVPETQVPTETVPATTEKIVSPQNNPVTTANEKELADKAKAEELKNLSRLTRLYANMKPEEASPIIKELDDALVVSIIRKMEDEPAAKLLAMMEPQRAAKITRMLKNPAGAVTQIPN